MAAHEPGSNSYALPVRSFARLYNAAQPRHVAGKSLLHENMDAALDSVLDLRGTKPGVAGQHGHVPWSKAVNGIPIGIEPNELSFSRHIDPVSVLGGQIGVGGCHPLRKQIRHRHQLYRAVRRIISIYNGAAAAPSAADQRKLNGVALSGVHIGKRGPDNYRGSSERSGALQKFTTGGWKGLRSTHRHHVNEVLSLRCGHCHSFSSVHEEEGEARTC